MAHAVGHWGEVEPLGDGCVLSMKVDSLHWPVMVLTQLDADFEVEEPEELREQLARAGERFRTAAR